MTDNKNKKRFNFRFFRVRDLVWIAIMVLVFVFGIGHFERVSIWPGAYWSTFRDDPSYQGLNFKDIEIQTSDGLTLDGWFCYVDEPRATVVFNHGNGGDISGFNEWARVLYELDLNVLLYDYRGYGESEGYITEEGTYIDGLAAYNWVKENYPEQPIILHGLSLGAAIATEVATQVDAAGLIFECGFTSIADVTSDRFGIIPFYLFATVEYDTINKIDQINMPLIVFHGRLDRIINFQHGERIFEKAKEPKWFFALNSGHICGLGDEEVYEHALDEFVREVLKEDDGEEESVISQ